MNIPQQLEKQARKRPQADALISADGRMTFSELERATQFTAAEFLRRGIQPGAGVLMLLPVGIPLYVHLIALFRIGAHAVLIDPGAGRAHLGAAVEMASPSAVIAGKKAKLLRLFVSEIRRIPLWVTPVTGGVGDGGKSSSLPSPRTETPALLTFTSGSTGRPKGMLRTHEFLLAQHAALEKSINLQPGERDLTTLPVFVLANLASGLTSILADCDFKHPGFVHGGRILRQIEREKPTRSCGSPAFYTRLAESAERRGRTIPSIRSIYTGGAPVFPSMVRQIKEAAHGSSVIIVYGSTEAEPIAHIDSIEFLELCSGRQARGLPAGKPVPEVEVAIFDPTCQPPDGCLDPKAFAAHLVPTGRPGELLVRGAHVGRGYLHGVGDVENKLRAGDQIWHRTGDAAWQDSDGRLWLLGRVHAAVRRRDGSILYPFEIEARLDAFPGIRRTALVEFQGSACLVVEPEPETQWCGEAFRRICMEFDVSQIRDLRKIPLDRRHNAKVDYPRLRERLEGSRSPAR